MKLKTAIFGLAFLFVAGCGEDNEVFEFESGTYNVTDAELSSANDECGLLGAYTATDKVIGVAVSGSTVTFNLAADPTADAATLPTASLDGNSIVVLDEANYTVAFGDTCVTRVKRNVTGEVVENNVANVTLSFTVTKESGTCGLDDTSFNAVPCSAAYNFTITKQGEEE